MQAKGGLSVRIVERPGKWMTSVELAALTRDLSEVAAKTLPAGSLTYGIFSGDRSRLEQSVITLVYDRTTKRPLAFNALALMDISLANRTQSVLHLGLVMVDPEVRGRGLSWILYGLTCLLMFFRNQFRPFWVSNVTQVPAVVGLVSEGFAGVFPHPSSEGRRSLVQLLLARQIMAHHRHVFGVGPEAGFDETRFVITNAYTGGSDDLKKTFADATKHRNEVYNRFCEEQLDYQRGDDFLQLGQMDLQSATGYLKDSVPRGSLAALFVASISVLLPRVILPVKHWFGANRHWSILRARP
jgi:hypothetical protein